MAPAIQFNRLTTKDNSAWDPFIRNISGADNDALLYGIYSIARQLVLLFVAGPWFSYNETARALIFARDYANVTDMPSMQKLMVRLC